MQVENIFIVAFVAFPTKRSPTLKPTNIIISMLGFLASTQPCILEVC